MNKLEITLFLFSFSNVHLSMGSVACRFDVGAFLCLLLQNTQPSVFEQLNFLFFHLSPLSSTPTG